jgi:hypothetical protein
MLVDMPKVPPRLRSLVVVLMAAGLVTTGPAAYGHANDETPTAAPVRAWTLTTKAGVSLLTTSKSMIFEHLLKPAVRVEATYRLGPRLGIGVEVSALLTGDANYAFESASLVFRAPLYDGEHFVMRLGWGFGVGSGPPILSADLTTAAVIVPTLQASLGFGWRVVKDRVEIGFEIIDEQLTVVSGALTVGVHL